MIGSLQKNTLWLTAATVIYTGCQWLTIVFLSRFHDRSALGYYALAGAIVTPFFALTNLQLRYLLCSDAKREYSFGNYLALRTATVVASLCAAAVWSALYRPEILLVVVALAISRGGDALSDIAYGFLQANERIDRISLSLMLQGPIQLVLFAFVTAITGSLLLGVAAAAIVSWAVFLIFDRASLRIVGHGTEKLWHQIAPAIRLPSADLAKLRTLLWLGLPMGLVLGMNSLIGNLPRYFLASGGGEEVVGTFSALFYMTLPGGLVVAAYCDSACTRLAQWGADEKFGHVWRLVGGLTAVAGLIGLTGWVVVYLAGSSVVSLCYGARYAKYNDSLLWLMAGAGFMYVSTVLGYAVTSLREFRSQVPFRFIHLLVIAGVCWYWIPRQGLIGAAKSIFVSSIVFAAAMAGLLLIVIRKRTSQIHPSACARPVVPAEIATDLP